MTDFIPAPEETEMYEGELSGYLEWYAGKKADFASRKARLNAQYQAMLNDIERDEKNFDYFHSDRAERELRGALTGKKKSLKFLTGTVGLRKKPGSVNGSAVPLELWPEHLREAAVVTRVDNALLKKVVKVVGDTAYDATTGEPLALDGLNVTPESEVFYAKAGKEEE